MEAWDRWHYFPGTAPEGTTGENPSPGDRIEVQCKPKFTKIPGAPHPIFTITWDLTPSHGGIPFDQEIVQWRHLDEEQARAWQRLHDWGEARVK